MWKCQNWAIKLNKDKTIWSKTTEFECTAAPEQIFITDGRWLIYLWNPQAVISAFLVTGRKFRPNGYISPEAKILARGCFSLFCSKVEIQHWTLKNSYCLKTSSSFFLARFPGIPARVPGIPAQIFLKSTRGCFSLFCCRTKNLAWIGNLARGLKFLPRTGKGWFSSSGRNSGPLEFVGMQYICPGHHGPVWYLPAFGESLSHGAWERVFSARMADPA